MAESPLTYMFEGDKDHKEGKRRSDNPYLYKAIQWDKGWRTRQKHQLEDSGNRDGASRVNGFKAWIVDHLTVNT